jgi:hypothetical protein
MRTFYVFWFFFCSGWGYLLAQFQESESPTWGQVVVLFPAAFLFSFLLVWLELRRLQGGERAQRPSLALKPWDRPTGMALFGGLTFMFASLWGVGFSVVGGMSGVRVALHFMAMGVGLVTATLASYRLYPERYSA